MRQLEPEAGETQFLRESVGLASDFQQGRITVQQVISRILERNPGKQLLLVADQLEELYTLCPVKEEQERFANELLGYYYPRKYYSSVYITGGFLWLCLVLSSVSRCLAGIYPPVTQFHETGGITSQPLNYLPKN